MTPKLTPLPPWTATPAGLSMTSNASSSNTTRKPRLAPGGWTARLREHGSHRRNPHAIPRPEPVSRVDPAAVYPHLASPQEAIHVAARHPLQRPEEKVIDALRGVSFTDHNSVRALPNALILHILVSLP